MRRAGLICALAAALAGCRAVPAVEGAWEFARTDEGARLTYRRAGTEGPRLVCGEGDGWVYLQLEPSPAPPERGAVRMTVTAGQRVAGRVDVTQVDVTRAFHPMPDDGRFEAGFNLRDGLMGMFFGTQSLKAGDWTILPAADRARARADREALWRFNAICEEASPLSAITGDQPPASLYALLSGLDVSHAAADARRALALGDRRLLEVTSYSKSAPGEPRGYDHPYGYRRVDPTFDREMSEEHHRLKSQARVYAEVYNGVVLAAVGDTRAVPPPSMTVSELLAGGFHGHALVEVRGVVLLTIEGMHLIDEQDPEASIGLMTPDDMQSDPSLKRFALAAVEFAQPRPRQALRVAVRAYPETDERGRLLRLNLVDVSSQSTAGGVPWGLEPS